MNTNILSILGITLILSACGAGKDGTDGPKGGFNLFPVEKDIELGAQVANQIESDPSTYPILDSASNVAAYRYIYNVRDKILATGNVKYKDEFAWRVRIVKDDETLNAICTPGGYI
jgi:hypothetical protein